jgi:hypothetical protein
MRALALLAAAFGLLALAHGAPAQAAETARLCKASIQQVSDAPAGGFRLVTLYWPRAQQPDGRLLLAHATQPWALPDDERAQAFAEAARPYTSYLTNEKVARMVSDCFTGGRGFRKQRESRTDEEYRAEFVHRRGGLTVTVEESTAACQGTGAEPGSTCIRLTAWK